MHTTLSGVTAPRSSRPSWTVPTIIALAVLALGGLGFGLWALLRPVGAQPVAVATTPTTVAPAATLPLGGPAATACRQLDQYGTASLATMRAIGTTAANIGALLASLADIAIASNAAGDPQAGADAVKVTEQATALRAACVTGKYLPS